MTHVVPLPLTAHRQPSDPRNPRRDRSGYRLS